MLISSRCKHGFKPNWYKHTNNLEWYLLFMYVVFLGDAIVIVKAICASLLDTSVLVQRCALDLLALALPMHVEVIKFSHHDLVEVVAAATSVLLRRDMSLNRRLYNW